MKLETVKRVIFKKTRSGVLKKHFELIIKHFEYKGSFVGFSESGSKRAEILLKYRAFS